MFGFNKTGTTEVGAISKAQKAQSFKICVGRFHENKSLDIALYSGYYEGEFNKIEKGILWRQKKSKKSRTVPKKIERGPLFSSGFLCYVKKSKK